MPVSTYMNACKNLARMPASTLHACLHTPCTHARMPANALHASMQAPTWLPASICTHTCIHLHASLQAPTCMPAYTLHACLQTPESHPLLVHNTKTTSLTCGIDLKERRRGWSRSPQIVAQRWASETSLPSQTACKQPKVLLSLHREMAVDYLQVDK